MRTNLIRQPAAAIFSIGEGLGIPLLRSPKGQHGKMLKRRDVFRLEARSDCPQGWGPIRQALCAGCQNAATGGEIPLLLAVYWVTFSCVLKPEYIPQRRPHPALRATFPVRGEGIKKRLHGIVAPEIGISNTRMT